jgi:hypothetical protein
MLNRRQFLRSAGVALALPVLERYSFAAGGKPVPPRRILAVCNNLGLLPDKFFPVKGGRDYELSPTLSPLAKHKEAFTVFGGVMHPDVDGGHPADNCFLTCAPHPSNGGFRNTISLDQYAAQYIGHLTRFPSLTFGVNIQGGLRSLSWTASGVLIPCEEKPSAIYAKLFLRGTPEEVQAQIRRLELGRSIMDAVADQAKGLEGQVGARDRERNYPLPNLFVTMLQRLGLETDRFATSTGTMRGLDLA